MPPPTARVAALHVKSRTPGERGLPKHPVPEALVTARGMAGDHNVWRTEKKQGHNDYALLLHSAETLAELRAAGWPVMPGHLGENVLTEHLAYQAMQPGTRWRIGASEVEVVKVCDPCTNLAALPYVGQPRVAEFIKATLGRRGWYARVLREGRVRAGDAVAEL